MRTSTRILAATAIAPLLLGLASCSDDDQGREQESVTLDDRVAEDPAEPDTGPDGEVDIAARAMAATAAADAAEQETGGTAFEISFEDGGWEVDVLVEDSRVEVRVDASGAVTGTEPGNLDDDDREALTVAGTTLQTAIALAADAINAALEEVELEREGDVHVWQVQFAGPGEHEVQIDVASGEVLRIETDD